ncbi:MAG: hypothetical protein JWP28_203 [Phenylobacterium sp.]|jgi:hypothetical protein|uniref:hypothetical protein n=1 Tax=Phenylobacterium sp. TaxID=1871053 RepID=UPI00262A6183|nr:hypothetical protein [Phenylobacterium sp.]MDB5427563.1 hypothetical protein [Phenylobacterium sp.]MDB5496172.1 hypothetical protein [Phenylobacterium sp.]
MKAAAILLATLSFAAAGAATASARITDLDYLKANRCRGLAAGLGIGDTASLDALLKTEGLSRNDVILQRGKDEQTRGKRDAARPDIRERLTAEVNGPCMAYLGGAKAAAVSR